MPKFTIRKCIATAALLAGPMSIMPLSASGVPDTIAARGEILVAAVHATGAQVYECKTDMSGRLAWQFREPIAALFADGKTVGRHYAGPHWEMTDGSAVSARVSARAPGASENDIPLLKLDVASWRGTGQLAAVTTIQRINTKGGVAEGPCDAAGALLSVPYTADYTFYRKAAVSGSVPAPGAHRPAVVRHVPVATPMLVSPPTVGVIVVRRDTHDRPKKKKTTGGQPKSPPAQPAPPTAEPTTPPAPPSPPTAEPTTPPAPPATPNKVVRDHRGPNGASRGGVTVKDTPITYEDAKKVSNSGPSAKRKPDIRDHRGSATQPKNNTPPKSSAAGGAACGSSWKPCQTK